MRVCVFGAGAVGGDLAARIAAAGHDVSVVVRGSALQAIRADGLRVLAGNDTIHARVAAADDPAALGPQDVVIVTVKAHQLPAFAATAAPLLRADTAVVFAQNGIPWWYPGHDLGDLLDPGGVLEAVIGSDRTIGGVVYSANAIEAPGVIRNTSPDRDRLTLGAINGQVDTRIAPIAAMLEGAERPKYARKLRKLSRWNAIVLLSSSSRLFSGWCMPMWWL